MGRTSIVVVCFNHRSYIGACVEALDRAGLDPAETRLILIDNASTDGSAAYIRSEVLAPSGTETRGGLPTWFVASEENLGFAGGNNLAFRRAIEDGDEFVYMLNPDTEAEPGFLAAAVEATRSDPQIAFVQSLLLRSAQEGTVNTFGNAIHFLGFGYAAGDGQLLEDPSVRAWLAEERDIAYASGAGALARVSALREIGLFNEELFAYHEDLELGWRARLAGLRVVVAPRSRVRHKYEFSRSTRKFYWMERNRLLVLAWCYRAPTLALIAPALLAMEAGTWLFAWRSGWWREKARAYKYFAEPGQLARLWKTRAEVQRLRRRSDREATDLWTGEVVFPAVNPWLLTKVANPILSGYWRVVRSLVRW